MQKFCRIRTRRKVRRAAGSLAATANISGTAFGRVGAVSLVLDQEDVFDQTLAPRWDRQKYVCTAHAWGRILYSAETPPKTPPDSTQRESRSLTS